MPRAIPFYTCTTFTINARNLHFSHNMLHLCKLHNLHTIVRLGWKWLTMINLLAYWFIAWIMAEKSFIAQTTDVCFTRLSKIVWASQKMQWLLPKLFVCLLFKLIFRKTSEFVKQIHNHDWRHDIQHDNIQHNDTHQNDTNHNGRPLLYRVSFMLSVVYAECHLCWVSLCWMSWRPWLI